MAIEIKGKLFLTVEEAATLIGLSKHSVYKSWKRDWRWNGYRFGAQTLLFKKADVEQWMDSQLVGLDHAG